jgi:hypothetical protein
MEQKYARNLDCAGEQSKKRKNVAKMFGVLDNYQYLCSVILKTIFLP